MCCTGGLAVTIVCLAWAFHVLIWPEAHRDSTYPPPDWLCSPERKWLRYVLAGLVGLGFLLLLGALLVGLVPAAVAMPRLALCIVGVVLVGWGVGRLSEPPSSTTQRSLEWLLPVRGRWAPGFLIALGLFALGVAWRLRD